MTPAFIHDADWIQEKLDASLKPYHNCAILYRGKLQKIGNTSSAENKLQVSRKMMIVVEISWIGLKIS